MSETAQTGFGICSLAGGLAGLIASFLVWRSGRVELEHLKRRLDLPKGP